MGLPGACRLLPGQHDGAALNADPAPNEALSAVLELLRLERTGHDRCTGSSLNHLTGRIYGGQVLFAGSPEDLVADENVRRLYLGESFTL